MLISNDASYCGLAYVMNDPRTFNYPFSVVSPNCLPLTLAHELGHNFGMQHDHDQYTAGAGSSTACQEALLLTLHRGLVVRAPQLSAHPSTPGVRSWTLPARLLHAAVAKAVFHQVLLLLCRHAVQAVFVRLQGARPVQHHHGVPVQPVHQLPQLRPCPRIPFFRCPRRCAAPAQAGHLLHRMSWSCTSGHEHELCSSQQRRPVARLRLLSTPPHGLS